VARRRIRGHARDRDDDVAELLAELQSAARTDPDERLHAELDELLEHDRRARAAHAGALHRDARALVRAGVAEEPALGVHLRRVREVRLGDVLRAERVAGQEARLGVIAGLGPQMDRHLPIPL
jgi:hypothetical protein